MERHEPQDDFSPQKRRRRTFLLLRGQSEKWPSLMNFKLHLPLSLPPSRLIRAPPATTQRNCCLLAAAASSSSPLNLFIFFWCSCREASLGKGNGVKKSVTLKEKHLSRQLN